MSDFQHPTGAAVDLAQAQIDRCLEEYGKGISDRRREAVDLAPAAGLERGEVEELFDDVDALAKDGALREPEASFKNLAMQPEVERPEVERPEVRKAEAQPEGVTITKRRLTGPAKAKTEPAAEAEPEPKPEPEPEPEGRAQEWINEQLEELEAENAAADQERKLWRVAEALKVLGANGFDPRVAGSIIWRLTDGSRDGATVFEDWLGPEAREIWAQGLAGARHLPEEIYTAAAAKGWRYPIVLSPNRLNQVVEQSETALVRAGAEVFQSGDRLVRPVRIDAEATKKRKIKTAVLHGIDAAFLKTELTRCLDFHKVNRDGDREPTGPSEDVVRSVLSRFGNWRFPRVHGIIKSPTLRADCELLDEFPFCGAQGRSAALSGLITPNVRLLCDCVPLHAVTAPAPGTGKSFLIDVCAAIPTGDAMPIMATGSNAEEFEKRLNGEIRQGLALFSIDNVTTPVGGDALCQVIERPSYSYRILGLTKMGGPLKNVWTLFASGNNLRVRDDLTRRALLIRLDAGVELPENRQFASNPFAAVQADRGRYIAAALTIVKAYHAAGRPGRLPGIGDPFAGWSDNVRSALVWLGRVDPVATMDEGRANDPARQARIAILQAVFTAYGNKPRTAGEMVADAKAGALWCKPGQGLSQSFAGGDGKASNLKDAIIDYADAKLDAQHLGRKFAIDKDKITDGLVLRSIDWDTHNKRNVWRVERAGLKPPGGG